MSWPQTHMPLWHTSFCPQALPHAPQLLTSLCRLAQLFVAGQKLNPAAQLVHVVVVTGPPLLWVVIVWQGPFVQTVPQAPQLLGSLVTSTHLPPQAVLPLGQAVQALFWHAVPLGQRFPHVPQLLLSPVVSTQV